MPIQKLALTVNAFEGTELLETVLSELRDQVDLICALWQERSYWGNLMAEEDRDELWRLHKVGLIDELVDYKTDLNKPSNVQERAKRNTGIHLMRERGATHVLNIDADEFYDRDQFMAARALIDAQGWQATYCSYVNYYKDFNHCLVYGRTFLVPFIHSTDLCYDPKGPLPGPVDSTRILSMPPEARAEVLPEALIRMHHAAWIRKDIRKKLANWSSKHCYPPGLLDRAVAGWNNWREGDDAIMLFVVHNNRLRVRTLDSPLCKFKVPWQA